MIKANEPKKVPMTGTSMMYRLDAKTCRSMKEPFDEENAKADGVGIVVAAYWIARRISSIVGCVQTRQRYMQ